VGTTGVDDPKKRPGQKNIIKITGEKMKNNKLKIIFVVIELCLILNLILIPKFVVVYVFTGIFIFLIYKYFALDGMGFLYFSTLLFSLEYLSLYMPLGKKYSIYYFYISLFIYMVIYGIKILKNKKAFFNKNNFKNKYSIFFLVFATYSVFSISIAAHKLTALKAVVVYGIMFCFMLMLITENKNKDKLRKTIKLLEYIFIGILALGTLEIFGIRYGLRNHFIDYGISFSDFPYAKRIPVVFFYNPNNYAVFLVLAMIIIFCALIVTDNRKRKIYLGTLYFISQLQLIFTTSRTAWISLIFIIIFTYLFLVLFRIKGHRTSALKLGIVTLGIFTIGSFIPFMAPYYGKFITIVYQLRGHLFSNGGKAQPLVSVGEGGSVNNRYTILYDVFRGVFINKHYFGFGAGNTLYYIQDVHNTLGVSDIHSLVFEILGDFGIPMLAYTAYIYLGMIVDLLKNVIKEDLMKSKFSLMFGLCTLGFIFLSFGPSTVITFIPFWLLLGLSAGTALNK
jgi:teichuronic acid biosynthesis protein TuaE